MSVFNCIHCLYSFNTTMSALAFNNLSVLLPSLTFIFIFMSVLTCIYSFYLLYPTMSAVLLSHLSVPLTIHLYRYIHECIHLYSLLVFLNYNDKLLPK